jgi:uncharacterized membrane protein YkoI
MKSPGYRRKGMKYNKFVFLGVVILLALGLAMSTGCAKKEGEEQVEKPMAEELQAAEPEVELPAAVVQAIEENVPGAEIDFVEVAEEAGITLYDIEFKADRGEIEVAADGTVLDVVTFITMEELPEAAAKAIQDAIEGAKIKRLEKSEIRSEIKKEGEIGTLVKLDTPRYVYEAELEKDGQTGEIEVDADGNITEPLKWDTKDS